MAEVADQTVIGISFFISMYFIHSGPVMGMAVSAGKFPVIGCQMAV
jgi:hypothetical protein